MTIHAALLVFAKGIYFLLYTFKKESGAGCFIIMVIKHAQIGIKMFITAQIEGYSF